MNGERSKFEEYRDVPETVIVPQLQLLIGGKKQDFYLQFDSTNTGRDDQNYRLRFGRYGLLDVEFEWDQIPHTFSLGKARTPYSMNGGDYTLATKPTSTSGPAVRDWVNANATPTDLGLYNGLAKFKVRYTPSPCWTFTGSYGSQNTTGKRAFGALFGPIPGAYNITEIAEPIDYQTHNIELGGEYGGDGWSIGLKYNASLFHSNISTLTWDNPLTPGIGGACTDAALYSSEVEPCRGRVDLYPSNQAHTFTLNGTANLPLKTSFMGTLSYGWRLQDDSFLPFTINSAITQPSISRRNLAGDVRPTMVNLALVNNFFKDVNLKAHYRYFDFDNRSAKVFFEEGLVIDDQGGRSTDSATSPCPPAGTSCPDTGVRSFPFSYSKQNLGFDASYNVTRWLTAKMGYVWEKMHRERREVLNANEHTFGPTLDIKPSSWSLLRIGYKRSIRDAHDYDAGRVVVIHTEDTEQDLRDQRLADLRKWDEASRNRDKVNLFAQASPLQNLTLHAGFDFARDEYPRTEIGVQNDFNYAPSMGFTYAPLDWLTLFGDYNWERFDWKLRAMRRSNFSQTPATNPELVWVSRGRDQIHTFSIGGYSVLIKDVLGLRIQYGFSDARSLVRASGDAATPAADLPTITSRWHEFLARFEYQVIKNVALKFGYYYNRYNQKDQGVDIMQPWMGDVDTNPNIQRSIFLGDQPKGSYTAHVGFVGLKFKF